jgi:hypothetical protein
MGRLEHPYHDLAGGEWISGNLHSHTANSDGDRATQEVIDVYAELGHGFLMISDHDTFTSGEDYRSFDDRGLILIPGNEITANGPHMLHVGASSLVEPFEDRQMVIDKAAQSGGFTVFNHPKWLTHFNHCPQEVLEQCDGYAGIEIYNGVITFLPGSPYATDRWDLLLGAGRRLWGYANDDSHRASGNDGIGWNTVYVNERSAKAVVEALKTGRFYASSGVEILNIAVDGFHIEIETLNAQRIAALGDHAKRFAQVDAPSISIDIPTDFTYVRFEFWGSGESMAWTQPFFITGYPVAG